MQSQEVLLGLESGVNVNLYADAAYDFKQMEQIKDLGWNMGLDVTKLLNPLIPSDVMMNMRLESEALKSRILMK